MAVSVMTYGTRTAITIDPSSLAASSTFVAGVESAEQSNASDLYMDVLVEEGAISPEDLSLFRYTDDPQEAWDIIRTFYKL